MKHEIKTNEVISINPIAIKLKDYLNNSNLKVVSNMIFRYIPVTYQDIIMLTHGIKYTNNTEPQVLCNTFYLNMLLDSYNKHIEYCSHELTINELLEIVISKIERNTDIDSINNSMFSINDDYITIQHIVRQYTIYRKLSSDNKRLIDIGTINKYISMLSSVLNDYISTYSRLTNHYSIMSNVKEGELIVYDELITPPSDKLYTNINTRVLVGDVIDSLIYRDFNYYITGTKFIEEKIIFTTSTDVDIEFNDFTRIKKELVSKYITELKEQITLNENKITWIGDLDFSDMNGFLDLLRLFIRTTTSENKTSI